MAFIVKMPKLSDTMEEGAIASWLKEEGDFIEEGEAFVEIETDKAAMEYTSPEEGYLLKILVQPGSAVPLQSPMAIMGESKDEAYDENALLAETSSSSEPKKTEETQEKQEPPTKAETSDSPIVKAPATGRVKASPLAKKLAQSQSVDLTIVTGSGPQGRIVQKDIEQFLGTTTARQQSGSLVSKGSEKIPVNMMRKTIAKRLSQAKNEAPHFYLTTSIKMDNIVLWRSNVNDAKAVKEGKQPKTSINDLIVLATSKALLKHPDVNASWQGDFITKFHDVHIAIAVALENGLMTPVLRHTDRMGLNDITYSIRDLAQKAKNGDLTSDDYLGGTFTISNLGMTCVEEFTAIINPPQACILAVGTIVKKPYVDENDEIKIGQFLKVTLSCDHRVVDGMVGSLFLNTLKDYLENPLLMLS